MEEGGLKFHYVISMSNIIYHESLRNYRYIEMCPIIHVLYM